jgi:hypothetical protein
LQIHKSLYAAAYLQYACYVGQRKVSELALLEAQHLHVQLVDERSEYPQAIIAADVARFEAQPANHYDIRKD